MEAPARMQSKNLGSSDEVRSFEKSRMDVVNLGEDVVAGRAVFEPGWRWSEHVKPAAGTDSCQVPHVGYVVSGRLVVRMDDGSEQEIGPGDAVAIPQGTTPGPLGMKRVRCSTSRGPISTPRGPPRAAVEGALIGTGG